MKVVFMGTPDFSVPVLDAIHKAHEIVAVYCQPPRPAGRGKQLRASPVQEAAEALGVPVRSPKSLRGEAEQAAQADYLVNLLPDTPATANLFDARLLAQLKPCALFINAGRGAAVVDADLIAALEAGQLAGAVLDVCREEPLPPDHPFWSAPRLLLTGHSAAPTLPAPMVQLFLRNLQAYRAGQPLQGEVTFSRGY